MNSRDNMRAAGYESIRQFFKNRKNIINLMAVPLVIYTGFFLYKIIVSSFCCGIIIPNEYREAANIDLTRSIISGINPYSLKTLEGEVPGMMYLYGPLYSLVTAALSFVIPADIVALHYAVTFASMIISAFIAAWMIHEHTETVTAPAAGFTLMIVCTWRYGYVNAVPDTFALMLMMLILFAETRKKLKGKDLILAVLTIAIFFTKQYFLMVVATLVIAKFIYNRKSLGHFMISLGVLSIITGIAVTVACPLYWTYSIYFAHGPWGGSILGVDVASTGGNISEAVKDARNVISANAVDTDPSAGFGYEILQLRTLVGTFLFIFAAVFAAAAAAIKNKCRESSDFTKLFMIHMITASICLAYLGRNNGAWLSYYLQLLMPAVIIYAFVLTEKHIIGVQDGKYRGAYLLLFFLMIFFTIFRTDKRMPVYELSGDEKSAWEEAESILDEFSSKGEIYYYPILDYNAIKNDQYFYNNGQPMVITESFEREWHSVRWQQILFPYGDDVMLKNLEYRKEMIRKTESGEYSLITYISGAEDEKEMPSLKNIEKGPYEKINTIELKAGRMSYSVQFWANTSKQ